jgi:dynein heavy chain
MASSRDIAATKPSTRCHIGPRSTGDAPRRQPYLDIEEYNTLVAKNASKAAEGLCAWTKAMCSYQAASKIVKPKLEALKLAEAKLAEAQKELDKAEAKLQGVMDVLNKLQKQFEDQMAVKAEIEAGACAASLVMTSRF